MNVLNNKWVVADYYFVDQWDYLLVGYVVNYVAVMLLMLSVIYTLLCCFVKY